MHVDGAVAASVTSFQASPVDAPPATGAPRATGLAALAADLGVSAVVAQHVMGAQVSGSAFQSAHWGGGRAAVARASVF